jgi:hypothetical protein
MNVAKQHIVKCPALAKVPPATRSFGPPRDSRNLDDRLERLAAGDNAGNACASLPSDRPYLNPLAVSAFASKGNDRAGREVQVLDRLVRPEKNGILAQTDCVQVCRDRAEIP